MLQGIITNFLNECKHYHFSSKTIQAFTTRLNELDHFLKLQKIESVNEISYRHLLEFVEIGVTYLGKSQGKNALFLLGDSSSFKNP